MSYNRPSSWTPDIPGPMLSWRWSRFTIWRPIFWTFVWLFLVSAITVGVAIGTRL